MPGLMDILPRVKWLWAMQREDVLRGADSFSRPTRVKSPCKYRSYCTIMDEIRKGEIVCAKNCDVCKRNVSVS